MRSSRKYPWAILALVLFSMRAASAEDAAAERRKQLAAQFDRANRWALVVGINEYVDPKMTSLNFCVNDAELVAEVLVKRCGYPGKNVVLLADRQPAERLPTRQNILTHLTAMLKGIGQGDTVLVYVACHGGQIRGQSQICPRDFDVGNDGLTGLRVDLVREMLHDSRANQKVLILDCCHSGGAKAGVTLGLSGDDLAGGKATGGLITFAAARKNETSQETAEKRHGIFTYALAKGLAGAADADRDGIVDSDELYRHTHAEVVAAARKIGHEQTPVRILGEDVTGVFALARVAGEADLVAEMKTGQRIVNSIGMDLVLLLPGAVTLGSPDDEVARDPDERPLPVTVGRPFLLGRHEVTQAEYQKVTGANPSWFRAGGEGAAAVGDEDTSRLPVEQISWEEASAFCRKLSALPEEKKAGREYRLPTEGEWELACRAGTRTAFHVGERLTSREANVDGTKPYWDAPETPRLERTAAVGSYAPNAWGLCDMHGNVWEWCSDWYAEDRGRWASTIDPEGPADGTRRVLRGGGYLGSVALARSASRRDVDPGFRHRAVGFRVVCVAKGYSDH